MNAEIIAIGTELTSGAKLDTNSQWLSTQLAERGIQTMYHTTVADDLQANTNVVLTAIDRADLIILTGGLGPTLDDLTRQVLADAADVELHLHEPSLAHIEEMFTRRNRAMSQRNRIQAMFPVGSTPIPNPRGTAPGIWMSIARSDGRGDCLIAALPGVPSEMKPMFTESVIPRLPQRDTHIHLARLNCFGIGESDTERILGDLTSRGRDPEVGITASKSIITLRIIASGASPEHCRQKIAETETIARSKLSQYVFGIEDDTLEGVVAQRLIELQQTLCVVEIGTAGVLTHRWNSTHRADKCFRGGIVTPTVASAAKHVDLAIENFADEPIEDLACRFAMLAQEQTGTDFALVVMAAASNDPDQPPADIIALRHATNIACQQLLRLADATVADSRAAYTATNMLRLHLQRAV